MNKNYILVPWMKQVKKLMTAGVVNNLLLTGVPGSSKTSFAEYIANEENIKLFELNITSGMFPEEVIFNLLPRGTEVEVKKSALWCAFEESKFGKVILLIDEIDKGKERVEELLLRALETYTIDTPDGIVKGIRENIIVIATSNGYRDLMKPTLRRFHLRVDTELPSESLQKDIIKSCLVNDGFSIDDVNIKKVLDITYSLGKSLRDEYGADNAPSYTELAKIVEVVYTLRDTDSDLILKLVRPMLHKTDHTIKPPFKFIKGLKGCFMD